MASKIKIKRSAVAGKVPLTTDLELSELAVNTNDGRLYTKKDNGTESIVEIGGPDFGSRNVTTTGTSTAASFIPTSSTVPANGVYLPAANSVAISTNSTGRLFIDANGNVGLGGAPKGWGGGAIGALFNGSGSITAFSDEVSYGNNVYFNGAWRYARNDTAQLLQLGSGDIPLIFYSAATGTADAAISWSERFRVDASGRFGIGTSSPSANLHVAGTAIRVDGSTTATLNLNGSAYGMVSAGADLYLETAGAGNQVIFRRGGTESARFDASGRLGIGTTGPIGILSARAVTNGNLHIRDINTIVSGTGVALDVLNDASTTVQDLALRGATTSFHRAGSESARIDSSGRLLIGTSSAAAGNFHQITNTSSDTTLLVTKNNSDSAALPLAVFQTATTGNNIFVNFYTDSGGSFRGGIDYNRATGQVRYNVSSDQRLKSDIQPAESAVDVLSAIQVRSYKWNETDYKVNYGFVAQELFEVLPDAVKEGDDGNEVVDAWAVDNGKLVPLLTKALQEAMERIETLEAKVAALESA